MIVVWRVTQRCNLSCPFCGYDRRLSRPRRDADPDLIRSFGRVLAEHQQTGGESVLVSWIGGEPLLWSPLTDLTVFFIKELGLRVSTTTNGTTLGSAAVREHLLEHYSELTVSVDGVGIVHDELRGWPGGYGALRDSVTKIAAGKRTARRGPLLRANVVLMRQTISDFGRLCIELAGWGIEEITFNQLGGRDRPEFFSEHRLLPENAMWLQNELPQLRARLSALGARLNGGGAYLRRIHASTRDEGIAVADCHPGEQFLFVNEEGVVSPCSFTTTSYGIPLTELDRSETLNDLPHRFAQLRAERRLSACEDCQSTQVFEKFAA
jgi:MoaA/NifB/PqqE/SkfB family radical SAM enzyme